MAYGLLVLAFILFIIWIICFLAVHITAGAIHILLALAIILFIIHFVRGRSAV